MELFFSYACAHVVNDIKWNIDLSESFFSCLNNANNYADVKINNDVECGGDGDVDESDDNNKISVQPTIRYHNSQTANIHINSSK